MAFGFSSLSRTLFTTFFTLSLSAIGLGAETVPPLVEITTHGGVPFHTCQRKINLKGSFSDPAPSSGLASLTLNTGDPRRGSLGHWVFSNVPLELGLNEFTVMGADKDGNVAQDAIEILRVGPPTKPALNGPLQAATGVALTPVLSWTGTDLEADILQRFPDAATTYRVALDTSNPPRLIVWDNLTTPMCKVGPLEPSTTYYWQVKATNPCGRARSMIWSFTTRGLDASFVLHVDDNAPNDPGPDDPTVSDPLEDGSRDRPFDSIQEAIDAALAGDEVHVAEGWYSEAFYFNSSVQMADGVDLYGGYNGADWDERDPAAWRSIIDGNGTYRCLVFKDAEATLDGFTLQNGLADFCCIPDIVELGGGAVLAYASATVFSVTISNNVFQNNLAYYYGAGIRTGAGVDPTILGNVFTGNHVEVIAFGESGSAIYVESADATIIDNDIFENTIGGSDGFACAETKGGAVSIGGGEVVGNLVVDNSTFVPLSYCGYVRGGGIYVDIVALIENNLVSDNLLRFHHFEGEDDYEASGGGIYTNGGIVKGNTITANWAGSTGGFPYEDNDPAFNHLARGGGLYIGSGTAELNWIEGNELHATTTGVGFLFENGDAGGGTSLGGGIYAENAVVRNNVILNNLAEGNGFNGIPSRNVTPGTGTARGGGIHAVNSLSLNNTIAGNNALATSGLGPNGALVIREGGGYHSGGDSRLVNSIVWNNAPADLVGVPVEVVTYSDSADPTFLSGKGNLAADPLFIDGYRLDVNSPCINSGSPASEPLAGPVDFDGEDRVRLGRIDMGAYEAGAFNPDPGVSTTDPEPTMTWRVSPSDTTSEVGALFTLNVKLDPQVASPPGVNAFLFDSVYDAAVFDVSGIVVMNTQVADWLVVDGTAVEEGRYRIEAAAGLGAPIVGDSTAPLLTLVCRAASIPTDGTVCVENFLEGLQGASAGISKVTIVLAPTPTATATSTPAETETIAPTPTDPPEPTEASTPDPTKIPTATDTSAPIPTATAPPLAGAYPHRDLIADCDRNTPSNRESDGDRSRLPFAD